MSSQKNIPKLRFPEFRDTGVWEVKKLGEIAAFHKGKGISKADIDSNGKIPCVRYGELYTHYKEIISSIASKTNLSITELFLGCKNDVIIPSSGETKLDIATASCLTLDGVALGGDINVIRCDQNGIFMSYYLNACKKFEIAKIAQGDTVVHLYSSQLRKLDITLPSLPEQQKIADCLSSLDDRITAENEKLDTLKTHKKGLMQQLFPAQGETLPKLRFPEFRDTGVWEVKELSQVCQINPSVNNLPETFVYIDLESVDSGNLHQKKVISREGAPSRAQRLLKRHDVIFQMVRPYQRNNYYFDANDNISYVASTGYAQLRAHDSSLYLFQYLHNDNFVDRVLAKCTGSNYPAINSSDLSKILVEIPTLSEQQKRLFWV